MSGCCRFSHRGNSPESKHVMRSMTRYRCKSVIWLLLLAIFAGSAGLATTVSSTVGNDAAAHTDLDHRDHELRQISPHANQIADLHWDCDIGRETIECLFCIANLGQANLALDSTHKPLAQISSSLFVAPPRPTSIQPYSTAQGRAPPVRS